MTVSAQKLVRMAEQIAANVTVSDDPAVVAERTADHLNRFWDLRMRDEFLAYCTNDNNSLSTIIEATSRHVRGGHSRDAE